MRPELTPIARRNQVIVRLVALVLAGVMAAGLWWYELQVVRPRAACLQTPGGVWNADARTCHVPPSYACERAGGWWDPQSNSCGKVVYIPNITAGRPLKKSTPR
jgi:hypothetical protein